MDHQRMEPGKEQRTDGSRSIGKSETERSRATPPQQPQPAKVKVVLHLAPAEEPPRSQAACPPPEQTVSDRKAQIADPEQVPQPQIENRNSIANDPLPARMLNEFVYCPRLFYYEFVEGVFVESADTLRGSAIHQRVDSGSGALPPAAGDAKKSKAQSGAGTEPGEAQVQSGDGDRREVANDTIHSRSVQMGSDRLGVVAKMDLVESRADSEDLLAALDVCPVDYKAGAPREAEDGNQLWDTDKMQLGLQALILRDNGYTCNEGIIYYRTTKQRVRLLITPELESWIIGKIAEARRVATGPIPAPLVDSPKCVRCSLAPVCLPDESRLLNVPAEMAKATCEQSAADAAGPAAASATIAPRRLIAARDDTRPLYLNTQGFRVGCKNEVLQVKEKDKVVDEVRIRDLSHVALFGNIQVSTQAIQTLCELEVPLTYFSMGGWFYGITRGHGLKNVFLRMEQFRLARDEMTCLSLARRFVHAKIRNHRTLLMRNHIELPEPVILKLKRAADDALDAGSLEELLGIEGAAASQYFKEFSGMIKAGDDLNPAGAGSSGQTGQLNFNFVHRNRRPPTDPVNAMLSLAYSMLSKDCTLAALAVGFDPYVGFYHQPRFGRPALGLDLMEEFRPLIAESTVLSCINNRVITEKDFVRAGQAVNLSAPGRKRFFQTYEQRVSSLITHPLFDYKVSYRRALELQARLLSKTLTGEIPEYAPLLTR
jgi:CRISP-associated protein Cas1